jgi:hypothetical protein
VGYYRLDVTATTPDGTHAGSAVHHFSISEGVPSLPDVIQIESGLSQTGTVALDEWVYYSIRSTASDTEIEVKLTNLSADVDLYVRAGEKPTENEYDARPYNPGTNDEVSMLSNTEATTWYIGVHGYDAGSYTITVTLIISQQVILMWDPNMEPDLDGYKIYYGKSSGNYPNMIDVGNTETCTISGLMPGETYFFAAKAYNTFGIESGFSNELIYTVPF